jgi:hypothetical protein
MNVAQLLDGPSTVLLLTLDAKVRAASAERLAVTESSGAKDFTRTRELFDDGDLWKALNMPNMSPNGEPAEDEGEGKTTAETKRFKTAVSSVVLDRVMTDEFRSLFATGREQVAFSRSVVEEGAGPSDLTHFLSGLVSLAPARRAVSDEALLAAQQCSINNYLKEIETKYCTQYLGARFSEMNRLIKVKCNQSLYGKASLALVQVTQFTRVLCGLSLQQAAESQTRAQVGKMVREVLLGPHTGDCPSFSSLVKDAQVLPVDKAGTKVTGTSPEPLLARLLSVVPGNDDDAPVKDHRLRVSALASLVRCVIVTKDPSSLECTSFLELRDKLGANSYLVALVIAVLVRETFELSAGPKDKAGGASTDSKKSINSGLYSFARRVHSWLEFNKRAVKAEVDIFVTHKPAGEIAETAKGERRTSGKRPRVYPSDAMGSGSDESSEG